ncbi:MAG: hypothetical protein CYPHOPRED_001178 [Cyphobasidiales sp. Tagirdzhanova-0007]|nr:MAG: hypothetical protein CYPHOPRED_001178 [Cyphobasidiales sp. Tagirdzhanova-0007]
MHLVCTAFFLLAASALQGQGLSIGSNTQAARALVLVKDPVVNKTAVLQRNCAYFGWYPDDGNIVYGSQGTAQSLQEIDTAVGIPSFAVGGYAHQDNSTYIPGDPSTYFNGSEIMPFLQQALVANATFVASVEPVHGYGGFTADDSTNLDALIDVLQQFVDAGVVVWLRWAHEFNWYTRPGSDFTDPTGKGAYYGGDAADYVTTWNTGMDYYTSLDAQPSDYLNILGYTQDFHDTFAVPYNLSFWLGETGTRSNSTANNLQWVETCTSQATCNAMPNYAGLFWFNFDKADIDHNLVVAPGAPGAQFVQLMESS